jgi:hypothetical protein
VFLKTSLEIPRYVFPDANEDDSSSDLDLGTDKRAPRSGEMDPHPIDWLSLSPSKIVLRVLVGRFEMEEVDASQDVLSAAHETSFYRVGTTRKRVECDPSPENPSAEAESGDSPGQRAVFRASA